jgi:hypothetical protein
MRTAIEVKDLNLRQWDYIQTNVPVDGREFLPGLPTACVMFEVSPDLTVLHVEMDLAEFIGLMLTLEAIKNEAAVANLAEGLLGETAGQGQDGDYPAGTKHVGPFELG